MVWITKPPLGTQLDWTNPLNQGLAGFWIFNEGMGNIVNDLSGNANTGTLTNMAFPSTTTSGWNPGRLGPAIAFDGVNDYVDAGNGTSLNITGDITVEAWVKRNSFGTYQAIINKQKAGNDYTEPYRLGFGTDNSLGFWLGGGGAIWNAFTFGTITDSNWNHIVVALSGTTAKAYLNGNQFGNSATFSGTRQYSGLSLLIGKEKYGYYFNGSIDEVRIYNRALSDSEIMELYINPYGMFLEEGCPEISCTLMII